MPNPSDEPQAFQDFRRWVQVNGGYIHESLCFQTKPTRTVIATRAISADTCILSCPFDLAITKDLAFGAVKACVWDATHMLETEVSKALPDRIDRLNERQIICAYIGLHWVCTDGINNGHLKHRPYLDVLPDSSDLRTPLHFTPAELALLTGTNLLGATLDRRKEWEHEWREVRDIFVDAVLSWGEGLTWDRWLTAATYLSSRAFPSSLLSPNPTKTMVSDASSYPVLLPILDCLNHARGHPVSWVVTSNPPKAAIPRPASPSYAMDSELATTPRQDSHINANVLHITLHLRAATPTVSEVFNNYGPKPNSELLLGYGFVLPSNPEDTIVLKLGGSSQRHEIGRNAAGRKGPTTPNEARLTQGKRSSSFVSLGPLSTSPPSGGAYMPHLASSPQSRGVHLPSPPASVSASPPNSNGNHAPPPPPYLAPNAALGSSTSSAHPPDLLPEPSAGLASLWDEVEKTVLSAGDDDESVTSVTSMEGGWEVALEVCEALDGMIRNKIGALPDMSEVPHLPSAGIRVDVRGMVAEYVKGQKEILEGILEYVELRKMGAIEKARASGLDVREMPEDEEEEEEDEEDSRVRMVTR